MRDDAGSSWVLPPPLSGPSFVLQDDRAGTLRCYGEAGPDSRSPVPTLLVHSVNAAASAYEVRPLFERYARVRPTYALDLPGFGLSERSPRVYSPRLMTDAVLAATREIRSRHGQVPIDALAVSLSSEYLARAAVEDPGAFRTLALVSPTGFSGTRRRVGNPGSTRSVPGLYGVLSCPLWGDACFGLLTRPTVIRYFLERTWGQKNIDEGLWRYDVETVKVHGAKYAPFYFLSGNLFSGDITRVYEDLSVPVWMAHGVRGDFVDYRLADSLKIRPHWHFSIFETGALPHFECPAEFASRYETFLVNAAGSG